MKKLFLLFVGVSMSTFVLTSCGGAATSEHSDECEEVKTEEVATEEVVAEDSAAVVADTNEVEADTTAAE